MAHLFEILHDGDILLVIPLTDLRETAFEQLYQETAGILAELNSSSMRHLVIDFHRTREFGSTAIGYFVTLWKRIREHDGRMAFCNLTAFERDILRVTKLDQLWSICDGREDAYKVVRE